MIKWLEDEASGVRAVYWSIFFLLAYAVYSGIFVITVLLLDVNLISISDSSSPREPIPIFTWSFPLVLFGAAFAEECIFRLPIAFFASFERWKVPGVFLFVIVSSVIFGYIHGNYFNILTQGMAGIIFSLNFLKCGGWNDDWPKALACSTLVHFSANMILVIITICFGGATF